MRMSEIREMGIKEAFSKLAELKNELAKERATIASGTRPENPGKIRSLRKNIARILTAVNEKRIAGEAVEQAAVEIAKERAERAAATAEKIGKIVEKIERKPEREAKPEKKKPEKGKGEKIKKTAGGKLRLPRLPIGKRGEKIAEKAKQAKGKHKKTGGEKA